MRAKSLQSCPTLCDPMDCSPPGASVHGIFQARVMEWAVISFSRGSSRPRGQPGSPALQADSYHLDRGEGRRESSRMLGRSRLPVGLVKLSGGRGAEPSVHHRVV